MRWLRDLRDGLNQLMADNLELLAVKMVLSQSGWRTSGTAAEDVRTLVEACAAAEKRLAAAVEGRRW